MSEATVEPDGRYWAFISYSHKDAVFGRRLHRRLEAYALPRRLVGQAAANGAVPRRLAPIFRDRDEFPAATDLSAKVRAALQASRSLIVVCSPTAAQSPWVAREIELFRALHPGRPILAAVQEGDPHDSFPEGLRRAGPGGAAVEPLAADFRRGHDGWDLGLLKLVAGVLGVGLDELIRRDAQRRARRVTAVTAGALALVLVMAVLTLFAISARQEAERQRNAAEGLVKFMHTDLRTQLRGLGRTDLLSAVNTQALYYLDHDAGALTPDLLAQRAQVLQAIGEDDENHDQHGTALALFQLAWRTTAALLAAEPNSPERLFDHAQSEYWLGFDEHEQKHYSGAKAHFKAYLWLAGRMVALAPNDPRSWRELSFAEGNLCTIALKSRQDAPAALKLCADALAHMKIAAHGHPKPSGIAADLSDKESWMGSAYQDNGDNARALEHWSIQTQMLGDLLKADPLNVELLSEWIALQRNLARADAETGGKDRARARLQSAVSLLDQMLLLDPAHKSWARQRQKIIDAIMKLDAN